jgi:excisionase family DNA binding protein
MPEFGGYVSLKEASEEIGCSKAFLQKMVNQGEIVPVWAGTIQLITREDVEKARARYEKNKRGE